jgi:hypothetical protein
MSARVLLAAAVACSLIVLTAGGCAKSADEVKAARAARTGGPGPAAAAPRAGKPITAVPGDAELVSAVANDNTASDVSPLFDLRFRLLARPEVAQPLQIEIVAVPATDTQFVRLQLSVVPGDGISLSGESTIEVRDRPTGERVRHTITVVPAQPGVLQLYVSAVAVTDKTALTRQFAIPLIAFGAQPAASTTR